MKGHLGSERGLPPNKRLTPGDRVFDKPFLKDLAEGAKASDAVALFHLIVKAEQNKAADLPSTQRRFLKMLSLHQYLIPEAAVRLLAETNTVEQTEAVIRAWQLFMLFAATCPIPDSIVCENVRLRDIIRGHCLLVAGNTQANGEVRSYATICLLRLSCCRAVHWPQCDFDRPLPYLRAFTDTRTLFGVSLAEVLFKEGRHQRILVPRILVRIITHIRDENGLITPDLFGSEREFQDRIDQTEQAIADLTAGARPGFGVYHAAFLALHFIESLQVPVLTEDALGAAASGANCIRATYLLPNEHRDTLMFVIGFLQEVVEGHNDAMDTVSRMWGRALAQQTGQGPAEFVRALIKDWETEEICEALFMETLRQSTRFAFSQSRRPTARDH
jgi:hypothetical protein